MASSGLLVIPPVSRKGGIKQMVLLPHIDFDLDAPPREVADAMVSLAEAYDNHTGALVNHDNLTRRALERAAFEVADDKWPRRRWPKIVVVLVVVAGLLLVGYAIVARAAGAYNESAAEMRAQAQALVQKQQQADDAAKAAAVAEQARADRELAQVKLCLFNDVGRFLGGAQPDTTCNQPATP